MSATTINVREYGLKGDGTDEDADLIEAMIEDALSRRMEPDGHGVVLYWPAGIYRIPRPIVTERSDYEFYKLRFRGDGKDQTHIRAKVHANNVFEFRNPEHHYSAQLSFHGIHFYGGNAVLLIDNCQYSEIVDCTFRRTGEGGGHSLTFQGNTGRVRILNVLAFHNEDVLWVERGEVLISDSNFGEDCGGIHVGSGSVRLVSSAFSNYTRNNQQLDFPPAAVTGANVQAFGCSVSIGHGTAFVNTNYPQTVVLEGNRYTLNGGAIIRTRFLADRRGHMGRGVSLRGGVCHVLNDSALWETVGGNPAANCSITGLRIFNPKQKACTVPDDFFDPRYRNTYRDNFVTQG